MASTSQGREYDDSLDCSRCIDRFDDPKMLTCMHTFCEECLESLLEGDEISCPYCQYVTKVEQNVKSLPTNWILKAKIEAWKWKESVELKESVEELGLVSCSECFEETAFQFCTDCELLLCNLCTAHHRRVIRSKDHVIIDDVEKLNSVKEENHASLLCEKHNEVQKYFCSKCKVHLCYDCTLGSSHRGHQLALHNDIMQGKIKGLEALIETGDVFSGTCSETLKDAKSFIKDAATAKANSVKNVEECFDVINDSLLKTKQNLINWLEAGHQQSTRSVNDAKKELNVLKDWLQYGSKVIDIQNKNKIHLNLLRAVSDCSSQIYNILAINDISSQCRNVRNCRSLISSTDRRKVGPYLSKREILKVDVTTRFDDIFNQIFNTEDCDSQTTTILKNVASANSSTSSYVSRDRKNHSGKVFYESPLRCKETKYQSINVDDNSLKLI